METLFGHVMNVVNPGSRDFEGLDLLLSESSVSSSSSSSSSSSPWWEVEGEKNSSQYKCRAAKMVFKPLDS